MTVTYDEISTAGALSVAAREIRQPKGERPANSQEMRPAINGKERALSPATAAALMVACPKCGAGQGEKCSTTSGGAAGRPHDQRCQAALPVTVSGTGWAAERDQLTTQVQDLTERLDFANGCLSAASRNESDFTVELQDLRSKLHVAQMERHAARTERDDLDVRLATARRACEAAQVAIEAGAAEVSDLERRLAESSTRVPAAARPVVVKAGWERDLARRYLEAKFRVLPAPERCNVAERWVAAMATGDKAGAERLIGVVEARWAQVHGACVTSQGG